MLPGTIQHPSRFQDYILRPRPTKKPVRQIPHSWMIASAGVVSPTNSAHNERPTVTDKRPVIPINA